MKRFLSVEEIPVWQKAHTLTLDVYKLTKSFPSDEKFGLVSQIKRSPSSIPANITEGFYRNTTKELIQYLYQARGSCGETLYHLLLSKDLGYLTIDSYLIIKQGYDEVGKQLNGWIKSLKEKITK